MDRKNWKKLKKRDIKHTNAQLADAERPGGAVIMEQTCSIPATTLTTCYSTPQSREATPQPPSPGEVTSEHDIVLELEDHHDNKMLEQGDDVLIRGSSERCSLPDSRPESRNSSEQLVSPSQSSSYEKLDV